MSIAEHFFIFVFIVLIFLVELLSVCHLLRHFCLNKLSGLCTKRRYLVAIVAIGLLCIRVKQVLLSRFSFVVKAYFAEAAIHRDLVTILKVLNFLLLRPSLLSCDRVYLLGHNLIGEGSPSEPGLVVDFGVETDKVLALCNFCTSAFPGSILVPQLLEVALLWSLALFLG